MHRVGLRFAFQTATFAHGTWTTDPRHLSAGNCTFVRLAPLILFPHGN